MAVVPGPLRRVARNRARLVAVSLLALVSLAAAGINVSAADRMQSLLDENWRGAYDILVTAEGSELAGLLPPNSLAAGEAGMTFEHLADIRSIRGVEVAAPIGEVIVPGLAARHVQFAIPKGAAGADDMPQAFRITVHLGTDDGLGSRLVSRETFDIVIDETERPAPERPAVVSCNYDGFDVDPEEYPLLFANCGGGIGEVPIVSHATGSGWSSSSEVQGDSVLFTLGSAVLPSTRITLVDPVAERTLLGDAGSFLAPLEALAADGGTPGARIAAWADTAGNEFAEKFRDQQVAMAGIPSPFSPELLDELARLYESNGGTFEWGQDAVEYVPLVVRETPPAPLTASMEVQSFGAAPPIPDDRGGLPYTMPEALTTGAEGTRLGWSGADASALLNPFSDGSVLVPWPGTSADGVDGMPWFSTLSIPAVGTAPAADFEVMADGADSVEVRIRPSGYVSPLFGNFNPDSYLTIESSGTKLGMESVFSAGVKTRALQLDHGLNAVAVGRFSVDAIAELQSELSHVPLGAYGAVGSTLVPGSSEAAQRGRELNPSVSGLGLVSTETVAIAPLSAASAWGDDAPINAVRIRVAGVDSFSTAGIATIAAVAQQIEALGFTATIVSGSSPTDVTVHVDDYAFGIGDQSEVQQIGPLGAVTQRWSELGAASRVDLAVSASSLGVLAVALGASALLLAAVQLASVPGRRAQAAVMRTIGWRRRSIVRWMAAEEVVSLVVVAVAGVAALVISSLRPTVGVVVGASVAALVVTSVLAVALGARPAGDGIQAVQKGTRRHRRAEFAAWVTSPFRFSVRQLTVHRVGAVVQLLATVVVAVASAAVAVTILEGRAAAGESALGDFASNQALISQVGLALVALISGVILAVIARRIDLDRRREQWATMRAMGFSSGQLRMVQLTEGLLIGVPSVVLGLAAAWIFVGAVAEELRDVSLPVATGAAALLTIILVLTSWREKR